MNSFNKYKELYNLYKTDREKFKKNQLVFFGKENSHIDNYIERCGTTQLKLKKKNVTALSACSEYVKDIQDKIINESSILFRGTSVGGVRSSFGVNIDNLHEDNVYTINGHFSTSWDLGTSISFLPRKRNDEEFNQPVLAIVNSTITMPVIYNEKNKPVEVIIPHTSQIRVTAKKEDVLLSAILQEFGSFIHEDINIDQSMSITVIRFEFDRGFLSTRKSLLCSSSVSTDTSYEYDPQEAGYRTSSPTYFRDGSDGSDGSDRSDGSYGGGIKIVWSALCMAIVLVSSILGSMTQHS